MSKRISDSKATEVAKAMSKGFLDKKRSLEKQLNDLVNNTLLALVPQEVLDLQNKYPNFIRTTPSFYLRKKQGDKTYYISGLTTPAVSVEADVLKQAVYDNPEAYAKAESLMDRIVSTDKKYYEMKHKIECALEKIRTYAKLQQEWPEAYAALMVVDGTPESTEGLCDSVENLRAELSKSSKNDN